MQDHLRLHTSPVARPGAVLMGDRWRISVLADGLLRLEWSDDGVFEDRASAFALHRDLPVPAFEVIDGEASLEIVTDRLRLTYDRGPFTPAGLSVQARGNVSDYHSVWRFGEPSDDLGGTARTLDDVDGRVAARARRRLALGVARARRLALVPVRRTTAGSPRARRPAPTSTSSPTATTTPTALGAFYAVSGPQPLLPRWALGNWWSRYHRYTADAYLALMDRFDAEGVPFSVAVLDMDWHRVDSVPPELRLAAGRATAGSRELFPDPEGFLAELHRRGLRVTLNVHPADGVRAFEDAYAAMAEALGRDPGRGEPIAFDITDPRLPRRLPRRRCTTRSRTRASTSGGWTGSRDRTRASPGIDPLWMLNHFHFLDSGRDGRRPLTFSRYAGPGSHRYPVGFSGDTLISWASLDFQPEFTATASNIGYGWWSHDIGGHIGGVRDDELATRWVQLGVFSPILRLHSSSNPFLVKEPWPYPARGPRRDGRRAAPAPPARALPAHDEPPRRGEGVAAGAAAVPRAPDDRARLRGARTSSRSAPSCSSRRSPRRATR